MLDGKQLLGFNPRPRTGSDPYTGRNSLQGKVSIHAPVPGATSQYRYCCQSSSVSIHAPVPGSDVIVGKLLPIVVVSIHAPVPGATSEHGFLVPFRQSRVSIHAPVPGATLGNWTGEFFEIMFQSTPPYRERRASWDEIVKAVWFQSTPRTGSDIFYS